MMRCRGSHVAFFRARHKVNWVEIREREGCIPSRIQALNFVILLNDGEHSVKRMIHGDEGTEINVYVSNP